ncbi:enoyl-CoA hydratase/isomerase family protein [Shimia sp. CNT1-13L.2]|uniref:enoyl-CoA hydratase/isomerase family protein n=1 Tax=Shimia sp. CNT1-13L.2 TaxID=2959663 RepID=UPI0020CB7C45|nr:enoyl-CoA hydratase/isomerase family protein [Shimia sp. CNT1-13L.2]MCP9483294.1 enoyl-CoA hydratase/isomerase family protein [Shimia sp. CNT1-13L.2]
MTKTDLIQTTREGALLIVTINRPDKANSLTTEMLVVLRDVFRGAAEDANLRAVLITGTGGRVFCAGADLNSLHDKQDGPDPWDEMARALHAVPMLTIAAINGPCMGGGLTLALGCDIRVCVPEARFSYPVLKNNVLPGRYDVDRLQALIGAGRSATILLGGDSVMADEAIAWGLADRMVDRGALEQTCRDLSATACAADRTHLKTLKSMLRGAA